MSATISPIDGRYSAQTQSLIEVFSEDALNQARVRVEIHYLIELTKELRIILPEDILNILMVKAYSLDKNDLDKIYQYENKLKHDVKAIEYFIRDLLPDNLQPLVHIGLTSEDINNVAYANIIRRGTTQLLDILLDVLIKLVDLADNTKDYVMMARTHGQPASPVTFGKEIGVFISRMVRQLHKIRSTEYLAKFSGATGTYAAMQVAYPSISWPSFSEKFLNLFNLTHNKITTQIEPHDWISELFDNIARLNNILIDFCQDMWRYISDYLVVQKANKDEVGSSTMPHKINPIQFENAEGNLSIANANLNFMSNKLTKSRLQRDLTDSTVMRNIGTIYAHCMLAYKSIINGLNRISINKEGMSSSIRPEVYTEGIQTILRTTGDTKAYETLKTLARGNEVGWSNLHDFCNNISDPITRERALDVIRGSYEGLSADIARTAIHEAMDYIERLR